MFALRRFLLAHRHLVALLCLAALAVRLLVPAGYMISTDHGRIAITLCPGAASAPVMDMASDMHHTTGDHGRSDDHGKASPPCAFSSLSVQALGGVDAVLLLAAIAFVMAIGLRPGRAPLRLLAPYLRPPLRGPPARP